MSPGLVQHPDLDRCHRLAAEQLVEMSLQPVEVLRMYRGPWLHAGHLLGEEAKHALTGRTDIDDAPVGRIETHDVAAVFGDESEPHLAFTKRAFRLQPLEVTFMKLRGDPRHDAHEDQDGR